MRALVVYGGPYPNGNSDCLGDLASEMCALEGFSVTKIVLRARRIRACSADNYCMTHDRCSLRDDMDDLYPLVENANLIVLTTPVHFFSVSAHMQLFVERCQYFHAKKYIRKMRVGPLNEPRRGALIAVGAMKNETLFEGLRTSAKYFFKSVNCEKSDALIITGLEEHGSAANTPAIRERVRAFVNALVLDSQ